MSERTNQNLWNFFFSVLYPVLLFLSGYVIWVKYSGIPSNIGLAVVVLLTLSTFRLIRLFVYDKITQWFRDLFLDVEVIADDVTVLKKPRTGVRRTISDLLDCPWCVAPWFAPILLTFYFLYPAPAFYLLLVLSVAGVASVLQVLSNMIGWRAEYFKREAQGE